MNEPEEVAIQGRFDQLLAGDWGLHLVEASSYAADDICYGPNGEIRFLDEYIGDANSTYVLYLSFGYSPDAALRSYDLWFRGVDDADRVVAAYASQKKKIRYYPDLNSFLIVNGVIQKYRTEIEVCTNYLDDNKNPNSMPLSLNFEFCSMAWNHNDSLSYRYDENTPADEIPPGFGG